MKEYQFIIIVLPDLTPKCLVYSKSQGLKYNKLLKLINNNKISEEYDLYLITPCWIEKIQNLENVKFIDEFMTDFPKYRLQFYPKGYPQYILRFKPVVKEKTIEVHDWNVGIDSGSNVHLNDFLKAFSKTFFVEATEINFEFKNSTIKMDVPILSQKELLMKDSIELTFSMTDHEFSHAKKRIDVLKEIKTSEERYVADLKKITENFTEKIFQKYHIDSDVYRRTFKSVSEILPIHSFFLSSLQKIGSALETSIGPFFLKFIPFFKVAAPHVANFSSVIEEITDLVETNRPFGREIFQICRSEFKGNTVESLLVTPVQRIPRYPLLLKELLKCIPDCHWDKEDIKLAFDNLTKLNQEIDQKTSEQKSANAMAQLQKKLGNSYKVLAGGRYIISTLNSEDNFLYLFNDLLLVQLKHEESYKFKEFPLITTKCLKGKTDFTFSTKKNVFTFPVTDESQQFVEKFSKTKRDFLLKKCTFDGSLRWSSKPIKGPPELKSAAIASILCDLYLFGGKNKEDGTVTNDLWWYHKDEWELVEVTNAPQPRYDCTMNVYGTSLIVFGGHDNDNNIFDDLLVFDIPTANWIIIESDSNMKPTPRFAHAAAFLGSQLWIYGGKSKDTYFNDLYCYDFNYNDWWKISTTKTPEPRAWCTAFWIPEKILKKKRSKENATNPEEEENNVNDDENYVSECGANFAIFGGVYKSATYRTIWMFDYDNADWVEIETQGDQPTARFSHVSAQFNNALYVIGGRSMQDNSLDPYRLDMTTKPYTWSVLPQSDEPNTFDNGACCVIDDFGLALYNTTLYFIKFKQDFKNPEPSISTNEEAILNNKFDGTRLSRPIFNIESNTVSTFVDRPKSDFEFAYIFPEKKMESIMKRSDDGTVKWKENSVLRAGSFLLDESFFINEEENNPKLPLNNSENQAGQLNSKYKTTTSIPFFSDNKKKIKQNEHIFPNRRIRTMNERLSLNPNLESQNDKDALIKKEIPSSASVEFQYLNPMLNKENTNNESKNKIEKEDEKLTKQNSTTTISQETKKETEEQQMKQPTNLSTTTQASPTSPPKQQTNPSTQQTNITPKPTQPPINQTTTSAASPTTNIQRNQTAVKPAANNEAVNKPQTTSPATIKPPAQTTQEVTKQQPNAVTSPSAKQPATQTNPTIKPQPNTTITVANKPQQSQPTPQQNQTQANAKTQSNQTVATNPAAKPQQSQATVTKPQQISSNENKQTTAVLQQNQTNPANKPQITTAVQNKPQVNQTNQPNPANKPQTNTTVQNRPQTNQPNPANKTQTNTTAQNKPLTNQTNLVNKQQPSTNTTAPNKPQSNINTTTANKPQSNINTTTVNKPQATTAPQNRQMPNQANTAVQNKPQTNQTNRPQPNTTTIAPNKPQANTNTTTSNRPQTNQTNTANKQQPNTQNASTVKAQTSQANLANKPQTNPQQHTTNLVNKQLANSTTRPQTNPAAIKPQQSSTTITNKPQTNSTTTTKQPQANTANRPQQIQNSIKTQPNSAAVKPQQNSATRPQQNQNMPKQQQTQNVQRSQQNQNTQKPQQNQNAQRPQQNQAAAKPQQPNAQRPQQNSAASKPPQNQNVQKPQQNQNAQKLPQNQAAAKPQQNQNAQRPQQNQAAAKPQQNQNAQKLPQNQAAAKPQQPNAQRPPQTLNTQKPQQNQNAQKPQQNQAAAKPQQSNAQRPQQNSAAPKPPQNQASVKPQQTPNAQTTQNQAASKPQQNSATAKPQQPQNTQKPPQAQASTKQQQQSSAQRPQQNSATTKPQQTPNAQKPQQTLNAQKPQQTLNAQKPQQTPNAQKPQQTPNAQKPQQTPNAQKPQQTLNAQKPQQNQVASKPPQQSNTQRPQQNQATTKPQQSNAQNPQQNQAASKPPQQSNVQRPQQNSAAPKPQQTPNTQKQQQNQTAPKPQVSQTPTRPQTSQARKVAPSTVNSKQPASRLPLKQPPQNSTAKAKNGETHQIQPPLRQVSTAQKVPLRNQAKTSGTKAPAGGQIRKSQVNIKANSSLATTGNAKTINHPNPSQNK